jgi:uncharacterized protein (DUF2384 family)
MDAASTLPVQPGASPTLPMQFGVSLDEPWSFMLFIASLTAAIGLVYLFCQKKFEERSSTGSDDYATQLMPRQLATREEYAKGFLVYFGTMAATVLLLSLIGPKNIEALGVALPKDLSYSGVPIAVALVLVGLMPTVPVLLEVEKWLRRFAHDRAYIPAAARATAQRLAAADFDFAAYSCDVLDQPEMRGVEAADFTRPRRSLEHDWARLSCLVYEQKYRRMAGLMEWLDADLLRDYAKDLDSIEHSKTLMEADVAAYRRKKVKDPTYRNEALSRSIRDNLYKLYILLGCAVRLKKQPHGDIDLALGQFGFRLSHTESPPGNNDLKLVGLSIAAVSVLSIGLAATALGFFGLWVPSPVFPEKFYQPFIDTASTLIPHCVAIMVADLVRRHAINRGAWFRAMHQNRRAMTATYIRVALLCGLAGYVGLILWGVAFQSLTGPGLLIDAPNALLAMATGGFYVYHLDNVELRTRPSRPSEVAWQAVVTGVCGLIAAAESFELILGAASMAIDRIILTALISTTVGLVLAWYIPEAAAARVDPLAEAKEERVRMLEAKALSKFGNPVAATEWLARPNALLGNKSPSAAAADIDGYEHALSLLQHPRVLAA